MSPWGLQAQPDAPAPAAAPAPTGKYPTFADKYGAPAQSTTMEVQAQPAPTQPQASPWDNVPTGQDNAVANPWDL